MVATKKRRKIYFAGSIRGGRDDAGLYRELIVHLRQYGEVLTEHIGGEGLTPTGEETLTDEEIYERDLRWLLSSDVVVAEVTTPSLGVGFEIARAVEAGKRVLCLFRPGDGRRLSAMIAGCRGVVVREYRGGAEAFSVIAEFFKMMAYQELTQNVHFCREDAETRRKKYL